MPAPNSDGARAPWPTPPLRLAAQLPQPLQFALGVLATAGVGYTESQLGIAAAVGSQLFGAARTVAVKPALSALLKSGAITSVQERYRAVPELQGWVWQLRASAGWWPLIIGQATGISDTLARGWGEAGHSRLQVLVRLAVLNGDVDEVRRSLLEAIGPRYNLGPAVSSLLDGLETQALSGLDPELVAIISPVLADASQADAQVLDVLRRLQQALPAPDRAPAGSWQAVRAVVSQALALEALQQADHARAMQLSRVRNSAGDVVTPLGVWLPWLAGHATTDATIAAYTRTPLCDPSAPFPERKGKPRVRAVRWEGMASAFFLLALLSQDTPESNAKAEKVARLGLRQLTAPQVGRHVARAAWYLCCARAGKIPRDRDDHIGLPPGPIERLLVATIQAWFADRTQLDLSLLRYYPLTIDESQASGALDLGRMVLKRGFERLARAYSDDDAGREGVLDGLQQLYVHYQQSWLVRQWPPVLKRLNHSGILKEKELDSLLAGIVPSPDHAAAAQQAVTLVDLFRFKAAWERRMESIQSLLSRTRDSNTATTANATSAKRVAWILSHQHSRTAPELTPRLQTWQKDGYSSGRNIALQKLATADFPCELTAQDQEIVRCIRSDNIVAGYGYMDMTYHLPPSALRHLVGHPAVFDPEMTPLSVQEGIPSVMLTQQRQQLRIKCTPSFAEPVVCERVGTVATVYSLTEQQARVFEHLREIGPIPVSEVERARELFKQLSSIVMCADDQGTLGGAEEREADSTVVVQLSPAPERLQVNLVVRPLGRTGPALPVAHGSERVLAQIDGTPILAQRDFASERAQLEQLFVDAPALADSHQHVSLTATSQEWVSQFAVVDLQTMLEIVSQLSACGAAVEWPDGAPLRLKRGARVTLSVSSARSNDWLDASMAAELDDSQRLEYVTLLAAVQAGERFVQLQDGQYLELESALVRRLQHLAAYQLDPEQPGRVHPFALLGLSSDDDALSVTGDASARFESVRSVLSAPVRVPRGLKATLRDYQREGYEWLVRLSRLGAGACLADDMGLGKTVQTLALLLARASTKENSSTLQTTGIEARLGPALVIAPASVVGNWAKEAQRFAPSLSVTLLSEVPTSQASGPGEKCARVLPTLKRTSVVLCTYDLAYREHEALSTVEWGTLVLDESQAIKNPEARRTQAIASLSAGFRLALSGTPVENHLGELWSLFSVINPGLLGSRRIFSQRFQAPIERNRDASALRQLQALITPFVLRRTKQQVLTELPERTESVIEVQLSVQERQLYEMTRSDAIERLKRQRQGHNKPRQQGAIQILSELLKLRQLCCHPKLVFPSCDVQSSKHVELLELARELRENGHTALVFSQFVSHLEIVRQRFDEEGFSYLYLDGQTPAKVRTERVERFQAGAADFFLISLKAGGSGLNLTAADYVIHLDPWWNPAVEDQASSRAHRMGQTRPVTVYRLIAQDTIEEKLLALHSEKRDLADQVLQQTDAAARLGVEELLRLLEG